MREDVKYRYVCMLQHKLCKKNDFKTKIRNNKKSYVNNYFIRDTTTFCHHPNFIIIEVMFGEKTKYVFFFLLKSY